MQRMKTADYKRDNPWVREVACPNCSETIVAWTSSGMSACFPHFYCDCCSNVYLYEAGKKEVMASPLTPELVKEMDARLPDCPCGGRFKAGENPKCPKCGHDLKHQENAQRRLSDPHMIVVNRSCVYGDKLDPYRVMINLVSSIKPSCNRRK